MLYILGAGSAYPQNEISNDLLVRIGQFDISWLESLGIRTRKSILRPEYLIETGNASAAAAFKAMSVSPSALAVEAAKQAIARAGISIEQIGLVIGESGTPTEVTPSEGQRVAGLMGIKVASYDLASSTCSLILQLHTLASWRAETLPEYVLLVSSNVPTTRIDYRSGNEGAYFGDAAFALVVSTKHPGRLSLENANFGTMPGFVDGLTVSRCGHLELRAGFLDEFVIPKTEEQLKLALSASRVDALKAYYIVSDFSPKVAEVLSNSCQISSNLFLSNVRSFGCSLGTSPGALLADNWDKLSTAKSLVLVHAGAGLSFGYAVLKA